MRVVWMLTTEDGQEKLGECIWRDGAVAVDPEVELSAKELLHGIDRSSEAQVRAAFEKAPAMFDGSYVRAGFYPE
jgi:hypothetical protein